MTQEEQVKNMSREVLERNYMNMCRRISRLGVVASMIDRDGLGVVLRRIAFGQKPNALEVTIAKGSIS